MATKARQAEAIAAEAEVVASDGGKLSGEASRPEGDIPMAKPRGEGEGGRGKKDKPPPLPTAVEHESYLQRCARFNLLRARHQPKGHNWWQQATAAIDLRSDDASGQLDELEAMD